MRRQGRKTARQSRFARFSYEQSIGCPEEASFFVQFVYAKYSALVFFISCRISICSETFSNHNYLFDGAPMADSRLMRRRLILIRRPHAERSRVLKVERVGRVGEVLGSVAMPSLTRRKSILSNFSQGLCPDEVREKSQGEGARMGALKNQLNAEHFLSGFRFGNPFPRVDRIVFILFAILGDRFHLPLADRSGPCSMDSHRSGRRYCILGSHRPQKRPRRSTPAPSAVFSRVWMAARVGVPSSFRPDQHHRSVCCGRPRHSRDRLCGNLWRRHLQEYQRGIRLGRR